tara:strand:+ start:341 stop:586 length:246 start_codon:yes stop_codon:yes gene_type:complete
MSTNTTFTTEQEVLDHLKEVISGLSSEYNIVTITDAINALVEINADLNNIITLSTNIQMSTTTELKQEAKNRCPNVTDWSF